MSAPVLSRFTPSLLSPKDLEAVFIQREPLAKRLVEDTRQSALTAARHYNLLIGPRGIGKTHLAAIVYHRVAAMKDLRTRLAIAWLREEEWGVTSLLDFLLRVFRALREEQAAGLPEAEIEALYQETPERAEKLARDLLRKFLGKRTLLLIVENLDDLFHGLGDDGQKSLRAFLQDSASCTILATAPRLFAGIQLQNSPFYGFFRVQHLPEFTFDHAAELLERIARLRGQQDLAAFIQTPVGRARIRAIHHLASGCPRVYVILSEFLTRESLDELVTPFMRMLDDLTPYYQSRMAWLSQQQRKIIEFLVDHRSPAIVKSIAQRCFITQQTAASQLKKLDEMGYVHSESVGRESYYELREPLMRFCLEVKKQRQQPIRLFVDFLRIWWTRDELKTRLLLLKTQESVDKRYILKALELLQSDSNDPRVAACQRDFKKQFTSEDFSAALLSAEELAAIRGKEVDFAILGTVHLLLLKFEESISAFDSALRLNPGLAVVHYGKAVALLQLKRFGEAALAATASTQLNPAFVEGWVKLGEALEAQHKSREAMNAFVKATELAPTNSAAWCKRAWAEFSLQDLTSSMDSVTKSLMLDPNLEEAVFLKAQIYLVSEDWQKAIDICEAIVGVSHIATMARFTKAAAYAGAGRWPDLLKQVQAAISSIREEKLATPGFGLVAHLVSTGASNYGLPKDVLEKLIALFSPHGMLPDLVVSLIFDWSQSGSALDRQAEIVEALTKSKDPTLPTRLLQVALAYKQSPDEKLLLELPAEERSLLELALNPPKPGLPSAASPKSPSRKQKKSAR